SRPWSRSDLAPVEPTRPQDGGPGGKSNPQSPLALWPWGSPEPSGQALKPTSLLSCHTLIIMSITCLQCSTTIASYFLSMDVILHSCLPHHTTNFPLDLYVVPKL